MGIWKLPERVLLTKNSRTLAVGSGKYFAGSPRGPPLKRKTLYVVLEPQQRHYELFKQHGNPEHVEYLPYSAQMFRLPRDFFDEMHLYNVLNEPPYGLHQMEWLDRNLDVVKPGGRIKIGHTLTPGLTWMRQIREHLEKNGFKAKTLAHWDPDLEEIDAENKARFIEHMGESVMDHIKKGAILVEFTRLQEQKKQPATNR